MEQFHGSKEPPRTVGSWQKVELPSAAFGRNLSVNKMGSHKRLLWYPGVTCNKPKEN